MDALTLSFLGRNIPTSVLLRTKVFQVMNAKESWRKWSDRTWDICLTKAKRELGKGK